MSAGFHYFTNFLGFPWSTHNGGVVYDKAEFKCSGWGSFPRSGELGLAFQF